MPSAAIPDAEVPRSTVFRSVGSGIKARNEPSMALPTTMPRSSLGCGRAASLRRVDSSRNAAPTYSVSSDPTKIRTRLAELMPCGDEITVLIKNLDTTVATIGDINSPERAADEYVVRIIEIAGRRSFMAPGLDEVAVAGKLKDSAIV